MSEELIINYNNSYIEYKGFHTLHNWAGRTSSFESNIDCKDYKALKNGRYDDCSIDVFSNVDSFDSKNENRDSNMFDAVEGYLYPLVSFKSQEIGLSKIKGVLSFHGIKKYIDVNFEFKLIDNMFKSNAKFLLNLEDYNINLPSLLFFQIENEIEVEVYLEGSLK